jgi:hypothetical protein
VGDLHLLFFASFLAHSELGSFCQIAVFGFVPPKWLIYNRALVDLARAITASSRAPAVPYRVKTKGEVERPFRYIREDFFLGGVFRNLDDLNGQLRHWLDTVANPRVHATTRTVVNEAFAETKLSLQALPGPPYRAVLRLERRTSHDGMVSVGGNLYSVPDTTQRRVFDVHVLADEIRIFEDGVLVASHALLEGRGQIASSQASKGTQCLLRLLSLPPSKRTNPTVGAN